MKNRPLRGVAPKGTLPIHFSLAELDHNSNIKPFHFLAYSVQNKDEIIQNIPFKLLIFFVDIKGYGNVKKMDIYVQLQLTKLPLLYVDYNYELKSLDTKSLYFPIKILRF